jgi:hypothetical protein
MPPAGPSERPVLAHITRAQTSPCWHPEQHRMAPMRSPTGEVRASRTTTIARPAAPARDRWEWQRGPQPPRSEAPSRVARSGAHSTATRLAGVFVGSEGRWAPRSSGGLALSRRPLPPPPGCTERSTAGSTAPTGAQSRRPVDLRPQAWIARTCGFAVAPPVGLEPTTRCLEGSRSIHLSYEGGTRNHGSGQRYRAGGWDAGTSFGADQGVR